jgi:hypothetical protein
VGYCKRKVVNLLPLDAKEAEITRREIGLEERHLE